MAELRYITNVTLDGYIEDAQGSFEWSNPGDDYFAFITDLVRPCGTYLYGRRLYESMAVWETDPTIAAASEANADFARVWQGAEKVVYSTTLAEASTERTRLERSFDPDAVRALVAAADRDLMIGGAALAAEAFRAGLVDQVHLFVWPAIVGGGKPGLPGGVLLELELLDERRFADGATYVAYRAKR
jgi:dihydrofolate reductase